MKIHHTDTPYEDLVAFQRELGDHGFESTLSGGGYRTIEVIDKKLWPTERGSWSLDIPDLDDEDQASRIFCSAGNR